MWRIERIILNCVIYFRNNTSLILHTFVTMGNDRTVHHQIAHALHQTRITSDIWTTKSTSSTTIFKLLPPTRHPTHHLKIMLITTTINLPHLCLLCFKELPYARFRNTHALITTDTRLLKRLSKVTTPGIHHQWSSTHVYYLMLGKVI